MMRATIAALLVMLAPVVGYGYQSVNPVGDITSPATPATFTGDVDFDDSCALFVDTSGTNDAMVCCAGGCYGTTLGADEVPDPTVMSARNAWGQATVNTDGADYIIAAGIGRRLITATAFGATTVADTLTLTINGSDTTLTEGTEWDCITSTSVCATNLAAAITAVSGVTSTAIAAVVYVSKTAGSYVQTLTMVAADGGVDGVFGTVTQGIDGEVVVDGDLSVLGSVVASETFSAQLGTLAAGGISYSFAGDSDTGMWSGIVDELRFAGGGTNFLLLKSTVASFTVPVQAAGASSFEWAGRTELFSPADTKLQILADGAGAGVTLVATADTLTLRNKADDSDGAFAAGAATFSGTHSYMGGASVRDNATATTINTINVWEEALGTWTAQELNGMTVSGNDTTVTNAGTYLIIGTFSFTGANGDDIEIAISDDDAILDRCILERDLGVAAAVGAAALNCTVSIAAASVMKVEVRNKTDADNVTITHGSYTITQL